LRDKKNTKNFEIPKKLDLQAYEGYKRIIKDEEFKCKDKPFVVGSKDGRELNEPEVSLIKNKDVVTAIEVKCTCGKVIKIDCL